MKEPSLDHWTTAFALVAFLGLFIAPLLYSQAGQRKSQVRYVVAILVLFSVVLLYYVLWWSRYVQYFRYLNGSVELSFFLFGPLFYLYLQELTHQQIAAKARALHFLPFGLGLVLHLMLVTQSELGAQPGVLPPQGLPAYFYRALPWFSLVHLTTYAVAIIRLQAAFGALRHVAHWARWFTWCYLGFVLANWSYYLLVQLPFFNQSWDYGISLSMAVFISLVAVLAYVQPQIFQTNQLRYFEPKATGPGELAVSTNAEPATLAPAPTLATPTEPEVRYRNSGLPPHIASRLAQQLEELMRVEKLYHLSDLRLDTLAERLNLSRHHVSQVINEQLDMNFFEYINSLRIAEAKELLTRTSRQQLNISEVAYEVGFNNKVSFNKAFKSATGLTPSEFRLASQANPDRDYYPATTPELKNV
jgi:AraC-like DNA-binding protein